MHKKNLHFFLTPPSAPACFLFLVHALACT
uniref:Uncharacterized protein n=1 Tax=Rhizophora mucronata TaxID=61149 RepID=A0A2P2NZI9_RHIMU